MNREDESPGQEPVELAAIQEDAALEEIRPSRPEMTAEPDKAGGDEVEDIQHKEDEEKGETAQNIEDADRMEAQPEMKAEEMEAEEKVEAAVPDALFAEGAPQAFQYDIDKLGKVSIQHLTYKL